MKLTPEMQANVTTNVTTAEIAIDEIAKLLTTREQIAFFHELINSLEARALRAEASIEAFERLKAAHSESPENL